MNTHERQRSMAQAKDRANREFLDMTPEALDALRDIIGDPDINPIARVQAIALILDRGLGKPEENIRIQHAENDMEEAQERLDAIFAQVRKKME